MGEDASASVDTSANDSSASIENFDFSKPDGGLSEAASSNDAAADDDQAQPEDGAEQEEVDNPADQPQQGDPDPSKMSDSERNNFFAQRRIAEKKGGEQADQAFAGDLRTLLDQEYVGVEPDEEALENMDPEVAEHIKQLRQSERARDAERAVERITAVRSNTRLSVMEAETSIPMFNPADKAYNGALHEQALSDWAHRALIVQPDAKGVPQVIGMRAGAPTALEYLQEQAQKFESVLKAASLRGQRAAQMNQNRNTPRSTTSVARSGDNSASAIEARIGDIPLSSF